MAIDIFDSATDPMISDYVARRETGKACSLDEANAAVERACQAVSVNSEGDDCDKADLEARYERVRLAARACGLAERLGKADIARAFAKVCKGEAVILDQVNPERLTGLRRAEPLGDMGRTVKLH